MTDETGSRVVVRSFDLVRQVLRDEDGFHQAGFGAETVSRSAMRPPILFLEGPDHRSQRRAAARFFTPRAVEEYRPMMEALSERLVAELRSDRATDLSDLSLRMAVEVAARVVGLTSSSLTGMTRRLDTSSRATRCRPDSRCGDCRRWSAPRPPWLVSTGSFLLARRQARDPGATSAAAGRRHQPDPGAGFQRHRGAHRVRHLRRCGDGDDP